MRAFSFMVNPHVFRMADDGVQRGGQNDAWVAWLCLHGNIVITQVASGNTVNLLPCD
jgi:hypothetical protein